MRSIWAAVVLGMCVSAHAAAVTASDEFVELLKKNATDKRAGVDNPRQLFAKLTELSNRGDPSAQFLIGLTVLKERRQLAEEYLAASARSGCAGAEMGVGLLAMLNKHSVDGVAHFKVAAARGDATAQVSLSGLHERGDHGQEKSVSKAYAWLRLAERQTFSNGGLLAIREGMNKLRGRMTDEDMTQSEKDFSEISAAIPKVDYYFCGQFNVDTSRDPTVPYYFKF